MTNKKTKKPHKSHQKRPVRKPEVKTNAEVLVFDVVQKEKVVAEYRNETVQWYGTKLFRVYHPAFKEREDNSRLVYAMRVLGPLPEGEEKVGADNEAELIRNPQLLN